MVLPGTDPSTDGGAVTRQKFGSISTCAELYKCPVPNLCSAQPQLPSPIELGCSVLEPQNWSSSQLTGDSNSREMMLPPVLPCSGAETAGRWQEQVTHREERDKVSQPL